MVTKETPEWLSTPFVGSAFPRRGRFEHLLVAWRDLLHRYVKVSQRREWEDLPYWYREETLTGLLATAATGMGSSTIGISEYAVGRIGGPTEKGRGDAWLEIGTTDQPLGVNLEAKNCFPNAYTFVESDQTEFQAKWTQAHKQLTAIPKNQRGEVGLAVVYVMPMVYGDEANGRKQFRNILEHFSGDDYLDSRGVLCAYEGPEDVVEACSWSRKKGDRSWKFPGVILVGRLRWPNLSA